MEQLFLEKKHKGIKLYRGVHGKAIVMAGRDVMLKGSITECDAYYKQALVRIENNQRMDLWKSKN